MTVTAEKMAARQRKIIEKLLAAHKAQAKTADDPFAVFNEWGTEAESPGL
jgi:hypothetical protein